MFGDRRRGVGRVVGTTTDAAHPDRDVGDKEQADLTDVQSFCDIIDFRAFGFARKNRHRR